MSEKETRKKLIDLMIVSAGWGPITPYEENRDYTNESVTEFPTANGPADYVLFHNGRPLVIVEAKKLRIAPQNVLNQAQRYAKGFPHEHWDYHGFHIPFIYSTNGEIIWYQDLRQKNSSSREVKQLHTPQALEEILLRSDEER